MNYVSTRLELIKLLGEDLSGAEIGVMNGDFSAQILSLRNVDRLFLIDSWRYQAGSYERDPANVNQGGQDERARKVRDRFGHMKRVTIIRGESLTLAPTFREKFFDFVYLDAAHDFDSVLADLAAWSLRAKVLFVHDFVENEKSDGMGFGVVRAVTTFCQQSGWRVTALTTDDEWPTCELRPCSPA